MQTDTVVGIVGAVVLVSVMVGVFAYEYNNSDDVSDDENGGNGSTDPDGGNATVVEQLSGTVAQSSGSVASDTQTLTLEENATSLEIGLTYQRPVGLPGAIGQQPKLNFVLTDPNGQTHPFQENIGGPGEATVTVAWALGGDLPAGEWTLTASSNSAVSPAMSYAGEATVGYGSA